jgi:hypothetical protein
MEMVVMVKFMILLVQILRLGVEEEVVLLKECCHLYLLVQVVQVVVEMVVMIMVGYLNQVIMV